MNAVAKRETGLVIADSARQFNAVPGVIRAQEWIGWIPLVALPLAVLAFRDALPAWVFMWLLAAGIFAGFKWQTWWAAPAARRSRNWRRTLAYLLLWPGMDADEFFEPRRTDRRVAARQWLAAIGKTLAGATLTWAAAREIVSTHPMLAGWIAMIGLVLVLHFGTFQLIALAWQRVGIHAAPIMRRPLASQSLGEFWGKRWNLGFRKLSHALVFRPLQKRFGTATGTLGAFLASGLIHDLVISVPARAGYGLPTAYFVLQGLGALAERSGVGRRLGLGCGVRGRLWIALIAVGPVPLLFHPWFVMRVMVPFLRAIAG
ncbi:MAG: MBOAT family protein [Candidatus Acidiferrales bacterium]